MTQFQNKSFSVGTFSNKTEPECKICGANKVLYQKGNDYYCKEHYPYMTVIIKNEPEMRAIGDLGKI